MSGSPSVTQVEGKRFGEENLLPQEQRIMGNFSYIFAWVGGTVAIGTFMMGASLVPPAGELNLLQAFLAILIGSSVVAVALALSGRPGHKYGIPFIVQARASFGMKGTVVPGFIRAVPAIFWYGVQSWVGAMALNSVSAKLLGFENVMFYFILFQVIQILLSSLGFKGIKWLENIGAVAIIIALIFMLYVIMTNFSTQISTNLINIKGTWGLAFWGGTTAFLGTYTTLILNASDFSRELNKSTKASFTTVLYWIGLVPATMFMGVIGLLVAGATGSWDPIQLFTDVMPNPVILVITLLFIAIAQITTNVLNNVVAPAYVMMDVFGISYRKAAVFIGIIALFTFPWKIVTAGVFILFVQFYSAFLGPIFAVLIVDYFFIRRRTLDLALHYDQQGPYSGVNWQGMIAIAIGALVALIEVQLSWYSSLIPAGLSYYLLMKYFPISKDFLVGSVFEQKTTQNIEQSEKEISN